MRLWLRDTGLIETGPKVLNPLPTKSCETESAMTGAERSPIMSAPLVSADSFQAVMNAARLHLNALRRMENARKRAVRLDNEVHTAMNNGINSEKVLLEAANKLKRRNAAFVAIREASGDATTVYFNLTSPQA